LEKKKNYFGIPVVISNQILSLETSIKVGSNDSQLMEGSPSSFCGWHIYNIAKSENVFIFIMPQGLDINIKQSYR
jgi:hypothetical protein